eukprot:3937100-Rhodomonas_salina.1
MEVPEEQKECIFSGPFNAVESLTLDGFSEDPVVELGSAENGLVHFRMEICNEENTQGEFFDSYKDEKTMKMNCVFQSEHEQHWKDYCDLDEYESECAWFRNSEKASTIFELQCKTISGFELNSFTELVDIFEKSRDRIATKNPYMKCTDTPSFTERCVKTNIIDRLQYTSVIYESNAYEGGIDGETSEWHDKGFDDLGLDDYVVPSQYGVYGLEKPPATWDPDYNQHSHFVYRGKLVSRTYHKCPINMHKSGDHSREIPQNNMLNSMCHRINGPCTHSKAEEFMASANERSNSESQCLLRYAKLPPGVAGKFFSTTRKPDEWPAYKGNRQPAWVNCPSSQSGVAVYGSTKIAPNPKSDASNYPGWWAYSDDIVDCTRQVQEETSTFGKWGQCTKKMTIKKENIEQEVHDGCFIVDGSGPSEWNLNLNPECKDLKGACFFSFTLSEGYFCGTAVETDENGVQAPENTCTGSNRTDQHLFLVRGGLSRRSLWKCDTCLKFSRMQYTGRMNCGFKRNAQPDGLSVRVPDIVQEIKGYIRENVHGLANLKAISEEYTVKYGTQSVDYTGDDRVAFVPLTPLTFAAGFEHWGNADV